MATVMVMAPPHDGDAMMHHHHMSYGAATRIIVPGLGGPSDGYVTPTKAASPDKGIGGDNNSGSQYHGTPSTMAEESFEVDHFDQILYHPVSSETTNSAVKVEAPARHRHVSLARNRYIPLAQEFTARIILEVFGSTGAIWGFSEAIGLRNSSNSHFWRPAALCVGIVFFVRLIRRFRNKYSEIHRGLSAIPLNFGQSDLELEKEVGDDATYRTTSDSFNNSSNNVDISYTYGT